MTPSALLAEKIRETTRTKTDYAVAKALGMSQSNLRQVLMGERGLGNEACVRAAELLRQPLETVLAEIELPRAKTPEKRAFWEKRLPRLLPAVAIWGFAAGVTYFADFSHRGPNYLSDTLYIMRSRLRRWASSSRHMLRRTASGLGCFAT